MPAAAASDGTGVVMVCPTSHLDWDWKDTFAEYVTLGPTDDGAYAAGADTILDGVCELLGSQPTFCYSLAEVAYLRAYLRTNPDSLATLVKAGPDHFALLGGGITSPDNLVCHGEVFIRNYLLGRRWLTSVGLSANLAPVAWLPDDFGHDPQLPMVLAAMGLQWVGLSRVPGSTQPFANEPLETQIPSVAVQLENEGLVFPWIASDGSQVLAHFMPDTYGAPFYGSDVTDLEAFVENDWAWPSVKGERILFAPAGGDFALARWNVGGVAGDWLTVVTAYNKQRQRGKDPMAKIATFPQFMAAVANAAGPARSPLQAQNYWTGIFASRPPIKTLQSRAAQLAIGAEAAATLLRLTSTYSSTVLDDLDAEIDRAWETVVPSSHHDFVTGSTPDRVYWDEQLPLVQLAARLAGQSLTRAVELIAGVVTVSAGTSGSTPVVVFNPLGFGRGGVVELPARAVPEAVTQVMVGSTTAQVQRLGDGGLLFQVPAEDQVDSFGYTTVSLQAGPEPASSLPAPSDTVTMDNGVVSVTIDRSKSWAITSFTTADGQLLAAPALGNSIRLYNDTGNVYQFGNEPLNGPGQTGTFSDSGTSLVGDQGEWVEAGKLRWHFRATLTGEYQGSGFSVPVSYTVEYILCAGEAVVRMRLTGAAPAGTATPSGTTVVTAFDLAPPVDDAAYGLIYGTAHHYDDHQPTPYWTDPTFRSTHDFVQATGASGPGLAIYHEGVPAWSIANGQLLGALLRNPNGTQRGVAGTDPGVHTQQYALGPADQSPVATGDAWRTALAVSNPLIAAVVGPNRPTEDSISLPPQAGLAGIITPAGSTEPPLGSLRVARTQAGYSAETFNNYYAQRFSFILRVYVPDPASLGQQVTITLPSLPNPGIGGYDPDLTAEVVSALEEPVTTAPPVRVSRQTVSGNTVSYTVTFSPDRALTTLRLTATRWPTQPTDGKSGLEAGPPPHLD